MTENSNPTDNGLAERVNGIIKNEFLEPLQTPRNLHGANSMVDNAIHLYNNVRPHMNLHMQTLASVYENK